MKEMNRKFVLETVTCFLSACIGLSDCVMIPVTGNKCVHLFLCFF